MKTIIYTREQEYRTIGLSLIQTSSKEPARSASRQ